MSIESQFDIRHVIFAVAIQTRHSDDAVWNLVSEFCGSIFDPREKPDIVFASPNHILEYGYS